MAHDSSHEHHSHGSHSHNHAAASRNRLLIALGITVTVVVAEIAGALVSGSLALLADAGHMAVDAVGLVIALIAATLMTSGRTLGRTWGWARAEVLAAVLQAGMLLVICASILWEGIERLTQPVADLDAELMAVIGGVGLVANVISLLVLLSGHRESLNLKAAMLEVATDAFSSVAVIVAALVFLATGWPYADVAVSLLIAVLIVPRAFVLLRDSLRILLEATPAGLDLQQVTSRFLETEHVVEVHDLHASTISTGVVQLSAHIVVEEALQPDTYLELMAELQRCLREDFPVSINHSTLQFDTVAHSRSEHLQH